MHTLKLESVGGAKRVARGPSAMRFVSAEQFVEGLVAALSLEGKSRLNLHEPTLDLQFAKAYNELLDHAEELGLVPDFIISPDPDFGDSTCLRDTILSVRDRRSIALNNPKFVQLTINVKEGSAEDVLAQNAVPKELLVDWAKKHLVHIAQ